MKQSASSANKAERKKIGLRRRQDIGKLGKKQQKPILAYATHIHDLVTAEHDGTCSETMIQMAAKLFNKKPWQIRDAMDQYRTYHETFAHEHPANAFTPVIRKTPPAKREANVSASQSSSGSTAKTIHIALVPEPEQGRIKAFAEGIHELLEMRKVMKRLPKGELERAAETFHCTTDWISKSMERQRAFVADPKNKGEPFYNAHTPRQVGRQKGRDVPDEVREFIELARINTRWLSRNGNGGYDEFDQPIEKRAIHSLVVEHFGPIHSRATTYRIIRDFEQRHPSLITVAENGPEVLQKHLPAKTTKSAEPGMRGQIDARPFPVVVINGDVECTVHCTEFFDEATGFVVGYDVLPGKRISDNGEVCEQRFKDQVTRALVARATIVAGRFRMIYADHGYEAMEKHMVFMVASGEEPTRLIHSRSERPRGRGFVEHGVQLTDGFLATRPYYVRERDFRRSRKKKRSKLRMIAEFIKDFAKYIHHWNNDPAPDGGPSRAELFNRGPSFFLTTPSPENLAMFALAQTAVTRVPRRDGDVCFWYNNKGYEPFHRNAALYEKISDLSVKGGEIHVRMFEFGPEEKDQIVMFSVDDQATWELASVVGEHGISQRRHTEMMIEVEEKLSRKTTASLQAFFQKVILGNEKGPLVLNGMARDRHFYYHTPETSTPARQQSSVEGSVLPLQSLLIPEETPKPGQKKKRSRSAGSKKGTGAQNTLQAEASQADSGVPENAQTTSPVAKAPNVFEQLQQRRQKKDV